MKLVEVNSSSIVPSERPRGLKYVGFWALTKTLDIVWGDRTGYLSAIHHRQGVEASVRHRVEQRERIRDVVYEGLGEPIPEAVIIDATNRFTHTTPDVADPQIME